MIDALDANNIEANSKFKRVDIRDNEWVALIDNGDGTESCLNRAFLETVQNVCPLYTEAAKELRKKTISQFFKNAVIADKPRYAQCKEMDNGTICVAFHDHPVKLNSFSGKKDPVHFFLTPQEIRHQITGIAYRYRQIKNRNQSDTTLRQAQHHNLKMLHAMCRIPFKNG